MRGPGHTATGGGHLAPPVGHAARGGGFASQPALTVSSGATSAGTSTAGARSVPYDGPGNWYRPQTLAHFTALSLAAPDYLWLCQEASGNLASTIGSLSLLANASPLYQQTVSGWSCKFVGTDNTTVNQRFANSTALLDLAAGESIAMVAYASFVAAAASTRTFLSWGASTGNGLSITSPGGLPRVQFAGVATSGTINHSDITTVRQFCVYRNAATNVSGFFSDINPAGFTGTHAEQAITGESKGIFGGSTGTSFRACWLGIWKGANAERNWATYLAALRGP